MTKSPEFIMPAKPGPAELRLFELASRAAERDLTIRETGEIKKLIHDGADLGVYVEEGRCTLFERLIHAALQSDAIAQTPEYKGQKLLGDIFHRRFDVAEMAGADVSQRDLYRRTALILAAGDDKNDIAAALIAAGADVNAQDRDGETPLIIAARRGNTALVKALLARGARQDLCTTYAHTPLIAAISRAENWHLDQDKMEVALLLVAHGAEIDEKIDGRDSAIERLRMARCTAEADQLDAAAKARIAPALEALKRQRPGDKFQLKPKSPKP